MPSQASSASPVKLAPPPVPISDEIRDAASETLQLEHWLERGGWRSCVLKMNSPRSDVFIQGAVEFRARIDELADQTRRWRRVAYGAVAGCVLAVAVMASAPLLL